MPIFADFAMQERFRKSDFFEDTLFELCSVDARFTRIASSSHFSWQSRLLILDPYKVSSDSWEIE